MTTYNDPFDAAENPEINLPEYYGQAQLDMYFCILQKGVGKVPFDETKHNPTDRRTAIKLGIIPLAEQNITRDVYKDYIAESNAWSRITLPSIRAVGLKVRELHNAWVRMSYVKDGATYTNRNGETADSLALKVLAVYPDKAACLAAYQNQTVTSGQEPANGHTSNARDKETALEFIKTMIKTMHGDEVLLAETIANTPMLAKYFTIQSPEVRAALHVWEFEKLNKQAA